MRRFALRLAAGLVLPAVGCLWPLAASAKGGGVGFWMEGTVTNVTVSDERIHCQLAGQLCLVQYPGGSTNRQRIAVDCPRGVSVTLS